MLFRRNTSDQVPFHPETAFSPELNISLASLSSVLSDCADFIVRYVRIGSHSLSLPVCWMDGLTDGSEISGQIIRPLLTASCFTDCTGYDDIFSAAADMGIWSCTLHRRTDLNDLVSDLTSGYCALLFDTLGMALTFEVKSRNVRSVETPTVEKSVKGGKDAFVESLRTNTALVRRRLRTGALKLEQRSVGRKSRTTVALLYVDGVCNPRTLSLLRQRLGDIDIDGLTAAGNIEQYLTDHPRSPFPQLLHTERPDFFAAELLSGRIGLLADGLPIGFLLPATLSDFLRVAEDRAQHWLIASGLILLRWASALISALFPALLVAVSMYHQEMIPTKLLLSMIDAKQQVPFSEAVEVLAMLIAFELLMEAGIRLPDPVGDTVSIIGALIVGQSAVDARIVSPITVIVVATSAICGFTQPSRDLGGALRLARFGFVLLAVFFGLYGMALGGALLGWYLSSLDSFGVPYTAPMSEGGLKNTMYGMLRPPLEKTKLRPPYLRTPNRRNQK